MESDLKVGEILSRTINLVRDNIGMAAVALLLLGGLGIAADLSGVGNTTTLPFTLASLVAQYFVTRKLLDRLGLLGPDTRVRIAALFGVSFLTGIGILLGLVFLILPGLYLGARWSIAAPALIGEDVGVSEAISISWERTRGNVLHIALAFLILYLPLIVGLGMLGMGAGIAEASGNAPTPLLETVLSNLLVQLSVVLAWHMAVAIYVPTADHSGELAEVFA